MPPSEDDIKELKSMIAVAKRGPVNIGVCLGRAPEDSVVRMHRSRAASALEREAKAEGETTRTLGGSIEIDGRDARITCDGRPPASADKALKLFFRAIGIPLKITLVDEAGKEY